MRRFLGLCSAAFIVPLCLAAPAIAQFHQQHRSATVAPPSVHYFSLHSPAPTAPARPAANAAQGPAPQVGWTLNNSWHSQHHQRFSINSTIISYWGTGYPLVWSGAVTPAFVPYYPVYPYFVPAPQAPVADLIPDDAPDEPRPAPEPKVSSAEQKAKAGRFIGQGDIHFGNQKYYPAVEKYRSATQMAPDLAEPYFRQAFALAALGQYANAAKAFRRGLKIRGDWTGSPFRLDQVYGDAKLAKTGHIENLAKAVEANPLDASLLLVLGMELFFDGQPDRSTVFFKRAAQLGGNSDRLLDDFLPRPGPADAQQLGAGKIVF